MKKNLLMASFALVGSLLAAVPSKTTFIAHRGESHDAPENTLPAYKTAVSRGFGFECDIYLSADKKVFTFHDANLKRTTAGACTKKCAEANWETEISKVDVGGWGKWKGSKFSPTRPALLEEVLDLAVDGRMIYVEVKPGPEIVPYVKEIFAKQKKATPKNTLFISFNKASCAALKKQMPEFKVYWLSESSTLVRPKVAKGVKAKGGKGQKPKPEVKGVTAAKIIKVLKETKADGVDIHFDPRFITADFIKEIRDAGFECHVWTVDRLERSLQAFERGAQTVTTNCAQKQLEQYLAGQKK